MHRETPGLSAILELVDPPFRRRLPWLVLFMGLIGLLESISVASILPFIGLVSDPSLVESHRVLRWLKTALSPDDTQHFLVIMGLLVLLLISLANLISALGGWVVHSFVWEQHHLLCRRLFELYLRQPYTFFLGKNTSDLNKNLLSQVYLVITGILQPFLLVIGRAISASFILLLLFLVGWEMALLVVGILGATYALLFSWLKKRQEAMGREHTESNARRFRVSAEAFGGIKEAKVFGREEMLLRRFSDASLRFSSNFAANQVAGELPRYAVESLAFGGVLLILLVLLASGGDVRRALPLVSLYAFAGYKLLPSLQHIFHGLSRIRFHMFAMQELQEDLATLGEAAAKGDDLSPIEGPGWIDGTITLRESLSFSDVTFTYPEASKPALRGVSFSLHPGESVGVVGTTGAGKTTLVDLLLGLFFADSGAIASDGSLLSPSTRTAWQRLIGYVPQSIFLADASIAENISFGGVTEEMDRVALERAVRVAQLEDFIQGLPDGLDTQVGERGVRLSGGQRQRIGIARAVCRDPILLILDEATSALDAVTESAVLSGIQTSPGRRTVVSVTHRVSALRKCDRILVLRDGMVESEGDYESLMAGSRYFRSLAAELTDPVERQ